MKIFGKDISSVKIIGGLVAAAGIGITIIQSISERKEENRKDFWDGFDESDIKHLAFQTGCYFCHLCDGYMTYVEDEEVLICDECGNEIPYEMYGQEDGNEDEIMGYSLGIDAEEEVPFGCSACGGPYPYCTTSCILFDD